MAKHNIDAIKHEIESHPHLNNTKYLRVQPQFIEIGYKQIHESRLFALLDLCKSHSLRLTIYAQDKEEIDVTLYFKKAI